MQPRMSASTSTCSLASLPRRTALTAPPARTPRWASAATSSAMHCGRRLSGRRGTLTRLRRRCSSTSTTPAAAARAASWWTPSPKWCVLTYGGRAKLRVPPELGALLGCYKKQPGSSPRASYDCSETAKPVIECSYSSLRMCNTR
eukprot:352041-Chlamydomonas_euryale.AAC.4